MSKYKVGDKVVMKIISADQDEIKTYSVSGVDNNWRWCLPQNLLERYTEPLSTYTEPLEAKIRRQAAEITRLLAENKELKEDKAVLNAKIDAYELYGDQHEEEYNQAFNQGAEAAWELARKIAVIPKDGGYGGSKLIEIFNTALNNEIFNLTYPEAAAKLAEWEKAKEEIKVGDVVSHEEKYGVVISEGTICFRGFTDDGTPFEWYKERCTKTGRHIDIDSFLKQIGR